MKALPSILLLKISGLINKKSNVIPRFSPGRDWHINRRLDEALQLLQPIANMGSISWADLIVLAANTALEAAANNQFRLEFCPGRVDDTRGDAWEHVEPRIEGAYSEKADVFLVSTHMTTGSPKKMSFSGKTAITTFKLLQNAKVGGVLENSGYLLHHGH